MKRLNGQTTDLLQSEKIELLSDEVEEIMGHVPSWIVRWGITVIFALVVLLIAGSFVFKYPDVITSSVVIISKNPSASIVARTSGKIDNLLVQNEQVVKQGEILAILENSANYLHVIELKGKLEKFTGFFESPLNDYGLNLSGNYTLGPIQTAFSNFHRQYDGFRDFIQLGLIGKKISALKKQINDFGIYTSRLRSQALNQEKSLIITKKQLLRDSALFNGGAISAADYEKSEQSFLQVKSSYQSLMATVANSEMQINQFEAQVVDMESQQMDQVQTKLNALRESYDNLKAVIADWEKNFLLVSPVAGKIAFNRYWHDNQNVTSGESIFTVVPSSPQGIIGRAKIPVAGSGKIAVGQNVLVRLDNYPYMEYGMLEGKLASLSQVPENTQAGTFYTAEIAFSGGLKTSYQKTLPFQQELQGQAEIITKNLSLFDRLINPIRSAWNKSI